MPEAEHRQLGRPPLEQIAEGERRAHILAAATALFEQRGYAAVSLSDIASEVGVTKAALYHHFRSKDQLFAEVVSATLEAIAAGILSVAGLSLPIREKLTLLTRIAVVQVARDAELDAMLRDVAEHLPPALQARVAVAHQAMAGAYETLMHAALRDGELRGEDPRLLAHAYHYLLTGFSGRAGTDAGYQGREETVAAIVTLFLDGASAPTIRHQQHQGPT